MLLYRLNELWVKPPLEDVDGLLKATPDNVLCQPDKDKSEKWYRNIVSKVNLYFKDVQAPHLVYKFVLVNTLHV